MKKPSSLLLSLSLSSAILLGATACTKKEEASAPPANAPAAAAGTTTAATGAETAALLPATTKADVELTIATKGDELAYDKTALSVKAGQTVKLTFKNSSVSSGMSHNVAIVQSGKETDVANAGMAAGDGAGWLDTKAAGLIAYTKMVKPGESDSIVFKAPAAGSYPYICTFPGHAVVMKGVLTVN